jgi:hypothetical protein
MKNLPEISTYGDYDSDNYGAHSLMVRFNSFTLYYSYHTIVAYRDGVDGLVVCKNMWGTTTGKHLNWICDDKKTRLDCKEFQHKLEDMLSRNVKE